MDPIENKKKRQRSENWLEEDKIILKDLVKERVRVIENKNTDTNSNALKVAAWNDLKESFNCMCKGAPRTVTQIKAQWGLIKIKEKKTKAEQRREILKIGGGPPPVIEAISNDDISSWLPNEFVIDCNEFDSDNINQDKLIQDSCHSSKLNDMDVGKENINTNIIQEDVGKENPNNIQEIIIHVENIEAPSSPMPGISNSQLDPPVSPMPEQLQRAKPAKTKKKIHKPTTKVLSAAERVAACELDCRRELHAVQLRNELTKAANLKLEEDLLKYKIEYYKKKMNKLD